MCALRGARLRAEALQRRAQEALGAHGLVLLSELVVAAHEVDARGVEHLQEGWRWWWRRRWRSGRRGAVCRLWSKRERSATRLEREEQRDALELVRAAVYPVCTTDEQKRAT